MPERYGNRRGLHFRTRFYRAGLLWAVLAGCVVASLPAAAQPGRLGEPVTFEPGGSPFEIYRAVLRAGPYVAIDSLGLVTLSFTTTRVTPPCALAYGFLLPEQKLRTPRYCKRLVEPGGESDSLHSFTFSLASLTLDPCDPYDEIASAGGGTLYYELEIYDSYYDAQAALPFRFAFRDRRRVPCVSDGPWVDVVSQETAVVSWGTDLPAGGTLRYALRDAIGAAADLELEIAFPPGQRHEITIDGLGAGLECEYRICLDDPDGALCDGPYRFTIPFPDEPFLFAVLGDSQPGRGSGEERSNGVNLAKLRLFSRDAHARGAGFLLFMGDFGDGFTTSRRDLRYQWETWKRGAEIVGHRLPIYEIPGNHEGLLRAYNDPNGRVYIDRSGDRSVEALFDSLFTNPRNGPPAEREGAPPYGSTAYSFRWGSALFVGLNTFYWYCSHPEDYGGNLQGYILDGQLAWLTELLATAARDDAIRHVFIFQHHPAFPCGGHTGDAMWYHGGSATANRHHDGTPLDRAHVVARRDEFWQLLSECGKVRAVFCGHEHNHSRLLVDSRTAVYADESVNSAFRHPIWQCVSGGCGAVPYAEDPVPWSQQLDTFSMQAHYLLIGVSGSEIGLFATDDGLVEFDGTLLWSQGAPSRQATTLADWQMRCGNAGLPLRIERIWPQPGEGRLQLLYRALCSSFVAAEVHDIEGRRIRTLFEGLVTPGRHQLVWDGQDSDGHAAASGVFFVRIADGRGHEITRRVVLLR